MRVIGVIPVRMASSRFPGKPLAPLCGLPMVAHVWYRSRLSPALNDVYVATCDPEIARYSESIGAGAIMTADTHERASDRTAEAVALIEAHDGKEVDIAVMIQGDEPLVDPGMIGLLVESLLRDPRLDLANLMAPIGNDAEFADPNVVKVVVDRKNQALYFSREPIPSRKKWKGTFTAWKQTGIIAFRRSFLQRFLQLTPTPLEQVESVDMLRVLEHGHRVQMIPSPRSLYSVDTPEDLALVEELMAGDPVRRRYP